MNNYRSSTEKTQIRQGSRSAPPGREEDGAHRDRAALSKAHNRPFLVRAYKDGSLLQVEAPKIKVTGRHVYGKRGAVKTFSKGSRRRLLYKLAMLSRSIFPVFVTLTYPEIFPDPKTAKIHLSTLIKRLRRKFGQSCGIYRLEPQKRGAPHFHLLIWGVEYGDLRAWVPLNWFEIAGGGDPKHLLWHLGEAKDKQGRKNQHCVSKITSWRGVMSYASKYMSKVSDETWAEPGRFWGVFGSDLLPWAEIETAALTNKDAYNLLRLMRRYAKMRGRANRSLSIFCKPDFWFENLHRL